MNAAFDGLEAEARWYLMFPFNTDLKSSQSKPIWICIKAAAIFPFNNYLSCAKDGKYLKLKLPIQLVVETLVYTNSANNGTLTI